MRTRSRYYLLPRRLLALVTSLAFASLTCFPTFSQIAEADQQKIRYFHPDHLGSTALVTDEEGQVVERVEYKPFGDVHRREVRDPATGQLIVANAASTVTPFSFTGQRYDASTGLYFYNARYYDPQLGRFTQPDTIVQNPSDPQNLNRYSYVRNNPIRFVDPSGHFFKSLFQKMWGWLKDYRKDQWEQRMPQPDNPDWWFKQIRPNGPVSPEAGQEFNQALNYTATFLVNQWGFSPAAANATIAAVLAVPSGGSSLVAAALAYGTTELLGTGEARQLIGSLTGFFEDLGVSHDAAVTLANQIASAAVSVAVSVPSAAARELYIKVVHYQPTWAKGGAAVSKARGAPPVDGANNVGVQGGLPQPNSWWHEGGRISRVGNQIPMINATAGMHDMFQNSLDAVGNALGVGTTLGWALNVPGMPPAAALTFFALLRAQEISAIYGTGSYGVQDN